MKKNKISLFHDFNGITPEREWSFDDVLKFENIHQPSFFEGVEYIKGLKKEFNLLIYTDYDTDGLTSGIILKNSLSKFFDEVIVTSNNKENEAYNLSVDRFSKKMAEFTNDKKVVFMSADTGITDIEQFETFSKDERIEKTFILDHHEPRIGENGEELLPPADFVIDLKANTNKADIDTEYCTGGLTWIFSYNCQKTKVAKSQVKELLPLAAIATVTDMVPLEYGNYGIVSEGLKMLNSPRAKVAFKDNLKAFVKDIDFFEDKEYFKEFTSNVIGFEVGPVLNSSTRMTGKTDMAINAIEGEIINFLALKENNDKRKKILEALRNATKIVFETEALVIASISKEKLKDFVDSLNVKTEEEKEEILASFKYAGGLAGIIAADVLAGKILKEDETRPVKPQVAFCGIAENGKFHGSLRAKAGISIIDAMNALKASNNTKDNEIIKGGGHAGAAGMSVTLGKTGKLFKEFSSLIASQPNPEPTKVYGYEHLTIEEIQEFSKREAIYGIGRELPVFEIPRESLELIPEENNKKHQKWQLVSSSNKNKKGTKYFAPVVKYTDIDGESMLISLKVYQKDLDAGFDIFNDKFVVVVNFDITINGKELSLLPAEVGDDYVTI